MKDVYDDSGYVTRTLEKLVWSGSVRSILRSGVGETAAVGGRATRDSWRFWQNTSSCQDRESLSEEERRQGTRRSK